MNSDLGTDEETFPPPTFRRVTRVHRAGVRFSNATRAGAEKIDTLPQLDFDQSNVPRGVEETAEISTGETGGIFTRSLVRIDARCVGQEGSSVIEGVVEPNDTGECLAEQEATACGAVPDPLMNRPESMPVSLDVENLDLQDVVTACIVVGKPSPEGAPTSADELLVMNDDFERSREELKICDAESCAPLTVLEIGTIELDESRDPVSFDEDVETTDQEVARIEDYPHCTEELIGDDLTGAALIAALPVPSTNADCTDPVSNTVSFCDEQSVGIHLTDIARESTDVLLAEPETQICCSDEVPCSVSSVEEVATERESDCSISTRIAEDVAPQSVALLDHSAPLLHEAMADLTDESSCCLASQGEPEASDNDLCEIPAYDCPQGAEAEYPFFLPGEHVQTFEENLRSTDFSQPLTQSHAGVALAEDLLTEQYVKETQVPAVLPIARGTALCLEQTVELLNSMQVSVIIVLPQQAISPIVPPQEVALLIPEKASLKDPALPILKDVTAAGLLGESDIEGEVVDAHVAETRETSKSDSGNSVSRDLAMYAAQTLLDGNVLSRQDQELLRKALRPEVISFRNREARRLAAAMTKVDAKVNERVSKAYKRFDSLCCDDGDLPFWLEFTIEIVNEIARTKRFTGASLVLYRDNTTGEYDLIVTKQDGTRLSTTTREISSGDQMMLAALQVILDGTGTLVGGGQYRTFSDSFSRLKPWKLV